METDRYMQNCYLFSKFYGLVSELRSRFLVGEFASFIHEKILFFHENGYEHGYTLWSEVGGDNHSVYKGYVKISLSILRVVCLFFLCVVVVIVLMRFHGPYSLGSLYYSTFIFVAITMNMNITDRNQTTAKHHRSQTVCISLEMHRTLNLQ